MKNLINHITEENKRELNESLSDLKKETSIKDILNKWYYNNLIPASSRNRDWENVDQLKDYLIKRLNKKAAKKLNDQLSHIEQVKSAKELKIITISVEWKKSQMWGKNPTAEATVFYTDGTCEHFNSGSISGCGYDKESVAVAKAVNQSLSFRKLLYTLKDINIETKNHELFSYGIGYGILPHLEGGVGVSCYDDIMQKVGFSFKTIASGKTFDVFEISKI
jgi:hypothetical protein